LQRHKIALSTGGIEFHTRARYLEVRAVPDEPGHRWSEGDASVHLEELVVGELPELVPGGYVGRTEEVELVGPYLRMSGSLNIGQFRRISDFLNNQEGLIAVREATVLRRNGEPTKVHTQSIWVAPHELTLLAQHEAAEAAGAGDLQVPKVGVPLIVVTPGHTLTGEIYIGQDANLEMFIESPTPSFIPLTDVRTRSLADRRITSRYAFALLNRAHIVAATQLMPGMLRGGEVL
jgi:hypothetical protein